MANIDDRGHEKAELVMFDPQAPNFQNTVWFHERRRHGAFSW